MFIWVVMVECVAFKRRVVQFSKMGEELRMSFEKPMYFVSLDCDG